MTTKAEVIILLEAKLTRLDATRREAAQIGDIATITQVDGEIAETTNTLNDLQG